VDFNTYSIVTLNTDRTLAFINPYLKLNNAKLEGVVSLPADVTTMLHVPETRELWLVMREKDAIAIVDTDARRLKRTITLEPDSKPSAISLSGTQVWVSMRGRDEWQGFNIYQPDVAAIKIKAPHATALLSIESSKLIAGLSDKRVSLLNTSQASQVSREVNLGSTALSMAWSELSQRLLISTAAGDLLFVDATNTQNPVVATQVSLGAAATALTLIDKGRFALALLPTQKSVAIIDIAKAQVLQRVEVIADASQIALSPNFAYVHSAARAQASLLSLADVRTGSVKPIHIATGAPNSINPIANIISPLLHTTPDSMSMLIANPQDGQIYQYAEGMMAPVGSFSNYKRSATAMLVLNNGFEALGSGRYRTTVRYTQGGAYELVLSGVQPRFANCLAMQLPEADAKPTSLATAPQASLLSVKNSEASDALEVQVQLLDKRTQQTITAVPDLVLLAFDRRSGWQRRVTMVERAPGTYVAQFSATASRFDLLVSSATQDMPFGAGRVGSYEASKAITEARAKP
jgi:hypothetical protein